jgi:hypothetical protein
LDVATAPSLRQRCNVAWLTVVVLMVTIAHKTQCSYIAMIDGDLALSHLETLISAFRVRIAAD